MGLTKPGHITSSSKVLQGAFSFAQAMRSQDLGLSLVAYSAACSACAKAFQWQRALSLHLGTSGGIHLVDSGWLCAENRGSIANKI